MDLGRPIARHSVRRPHERDLEAAPSEPTTAQGSAPAEGARQHGPVEPTTR